MRKSESPPFNISLSVFLISVALIAYQLILIQILSVNQWYHFAYMIISVALLGFGAAGTFLAIFHSKLITKSDIVIPALIITSALIISCSVHLSQTDYFYFDPYYLFDDFSHLNKLILTYLLFVLPFFSGALVIGLVFVKYVDKIGVLYFVNMAGSGVGGFLSVLMMWIFLPEKLPAVLAFILIFAAIASVPKQLRSNFPVILTFIIAIITAVFLTPYQLRFSEYKAISKTLNMPETRIIKTESSPFGYLQLISSPFVRYAPGMSIKFPDTIPTVNTIYKNGDLLGPLMTEEDNSKFPFSYSTGNLPYITGKRKDILILNSGTGFEIQRALSESVSAVFAVEPDRFLIDLLSNRKISESGTVYNDRRVKIRNIYPRTYLQSTFAKFDLISIPVIGAFGGTSGVFALQEQYLLTVESFSNIMSKLKDEGVFCFSVWIDYPARNSLKLIATISESLEKRNILNLRDHIAAIKNWNTLTVIVKNLPLTKAETDSIRAFCSELKFDPVLLPDIKDEEKDYFNKSQDKSIYLYINKILESKESREKFYSEYPFNITPATDEQPYFSQFLTFDGIMQLSEIFGQKLLPFFEIGYILLYITFFQVLILSFILILLPQLKSGIRSRNRMKTLFYFSGIGIGYMFIEIVLIQKFTLYFGNVIYSAAAVVSLMLISSGTGSLVSQKMKALPNRIKGVTILIILSILFYYLFLTPILNTTIIFTIPVKIIFTVLLVMPPAFFMGMPFPLGLRLLASVSEPWSNRQIAWAWGINGMFSVNGAVLATIVAVELGFKWVIILAAVAYIIIITGGLIKNKLNYD
ncbi:MAG: hypothetical protein Kow0098_06190 [Ignavibacteriaceae bacterium]